jgi:hypothetical protein
MTSGPVGGDAPTAQSASPVPAAPRYSPGPPPAGYQGGSPVYPPPVAPHTAPRLFGNMRWWAAIVVVALIAAGVASGITYFVTRSASTEKVAPAAPGFSAAQISAAQTTLCHIFDVSVRGQAGQGGLVNNGQLNIPLMVRTLNSVVAVNNAIAPATPPNIADAARAYVQAALDATTAATGNTAIDEGNRLNDIANQRIDQLADACGLPH